MKNKDGFPCGLAKNEKIMSTTVLAYRKYLHSLKSAAYQKAQRDKDPEGYKRMEAARRREQRRKAKEAAGMAKETSKACRPAPKLSQEARTKMAVMEQYGYTVKRDAL